MGAELESSAKARRAGLSGAIRSQSRMRVGAEMLDTFVRGKAVSSLHPVQGVVAVARSAAQEPPPDLIRGRPQTGACTSSLMDASRMARWLCRRERIRFRPAALFLSGLILIGASHVADAGQASQRERTAPSHPFAAHITEASRRFAIPAESIRAVMRIESGNDRRAVSRKGAMGLMQIMPQTWAELRARYALGRNPFDPHDNILAGAALLHEMHDHDGSPGFLAAYNAGPGRYEEYRDRHRPLPFETVAYVAALIPFVGGGEIAGPVLMAASDPLPRSQNRSSPARRRHSESGSAVIRSSVGSHACCHSGTRSLGHRAAVRWPVCHCLDDTAHAMIGLPPRNRSADLRAPNAGDATTIVHVFMPQRGIGAVQQHLVVERTLAQISEDRTADRGRQQSTTGRGRDKRPCHVVIQDAVASCLSPGRPVGRGQAFAICPAIPIAVHAHCCLRAICHPERAVS